MSILTINQAAAYAKAAGFSGENLITILALAQAESGLNTTIQNSIGATGILQIYLAVHPDVTYNQAIDPAFSFRYAWKLSGGGTNFCPWQSYDSSVCGSSWDNRYKQFIPATRIAIGLPIADVPVATITNTIATGGQNLLSNASVTAFLQDFDSRCNVTNIFEIDTSALQTTIGGATVTDPIGWLNSLGNNIINDSVAFLLRTCFLLLGIYLLFRVIDHYLHLSAIIEQTISTVGKVAAI